MKVAELFVESLKAHGVERIFGVPGEENLVFLEALRKYKIEFITTRHEQGAIFMAATFARLTGKLGVALSTLGPGATNLATGVAYANLGGFPVLVITGQKPIKKSKQGKFQIIDVVAMMKPLTKFSCTIVDGNEISKITTEAINTALSNRTGAVHIELPEDIADEEIEAEVVSPKEISILSPNQKEIDEAISQIENSKSPIIVIGREGNNKFLRSELKSFIEKTRIPFVSTQMGKGVVDEESDLYIGTTSLSGGDYVHNVFKNSDLIIVVGHDIIEKPPFVSAKEDAKIIHINYLPVQKDRVYDPTYEVVGDIGKILSKMTEIRPNPEWDFDHFYKVRNELKKNISDFSNSEDFPIRIEKVVSDVKKAIPGDSILALDNGMYKIWFSRNYEVSIPNGMLLDNTLATMGAGLSSGIATKMVFPEKNVLVIAGDGGIMMNIVELETAVRLGVDLTVLILDDSGYGMIRWKQEDMGFPEFGLSFNNPDFIKLAESFGAKGYKVQKAEDLKELLEECLKTKGVKVVACPVSYVESNKVLKQIKNINI